MDSRWVFDSLPFEVPWLALDPAQASGTDLQNKGPIRKSSGRRGGGFFAVVGPGRINGGHSAYNTSPFIYTFTPCLTSMSY